MKKQANTGKIIINKKQPKETQGKQTMRMTIVERKSIACWPETDAEGSVESTSRGDTRKDQQWTMGGQVGAEESSGALKTGGESLSETPRVASTQSAKQPTNQNKQNRKKQRRDRG